MSEQVPELKIDKTAWGDGPWQTEPDRVDFQHAGYACLLLRHPHHGYWCAYVGVDRAHPYYGKKPNDCDVRTHRDLNYGARCDGLICHVPAPGMPADVWWLGFDCGHTWDLCPGLEAREREKAARIPALAALQKRKEELEIEAPFLRETYRPLAYVRAETKKLAAQLRALAQRRKAKP
jgi:hypothetical protein